MLLEDLGLTNDHIRKWGQLDEAEFRGYVAAKLIEIEKNQEEAKQDLKQYALTYNTRLESLETTRTELRTIYAIGMVIVPVIVTYVTKIFLGM